MKGLIAIYKIIRFIRGAADPFTYVDLVVDSTDSKKPGGRQRKRAKSSSKTPSLLGCLLGMTGIAAFTALGAGLFVIVLGLIVQTGASGPPNARPPSIERSTPVPSVRRPSANSILHQRASAQPDSSAGSDSLAAQKSTSTSPAADQPPEHSEASDDSNVIALEDVCELEAVYAFKIRVSDDDGLHDLFPNERQSLTWDSAEAIISIRTIDLNKRTVKYDCNNKTKSYVIPDGIPIHDSLKESELDPSLEYVDGTPILMNNDLYAWRNVTIKLYVRGKSDPLIRKFSNVPAQQRFAIARSGASDLASPPDRIEKFAITGQTPNGFKSAVGLVRE